MPWLIALATLALGSCAGPIQRAERLARAGDLEPLLIPGEGFDHRAFAKTRAGEDLLAVFIDGDGSPWIKGGRRIAADPTPRAPLALDLASRTPGSVLYLGRPCYFGAGPPPACRDAEWTSDRYSAAVVRSMNAAVMRYAAQRHFTRVLLVGYSGGGTLAVLMARDLPSAVGVITIAGNLDPDAWTRLHGYLPLTGSRNPASEPPLPPSRPEWHLIGLHDRNVPYAVAARYLRRLPDERTWRFADYDHVCCWVRDWPSIFARIRGELLPPDALPQRQERPSHPARHRSPS